MEKRNGRNGWSPTRPRLILRDYGYKVEIVEVKENGANPNGESFAQVSIPDGNKPYHFLEANPHTSRSLDVLFRWIKEYEADQHRKEGEVNGVERGG